MIIDDKIELLHGAYHVTLALTNGPDAFTEDERLAIQRFGEPTIALGGDIDFLEGSGSSDPTFTLPANNLRFPSQFPVKQMFPVTLTYANQRALAWRFAILTRLDAAMTALRTSAVGTTGRWTTTINTAD